MPPATSPRWCPTPEQIMILEEMYRSGIRTPNSSQIQKITAHLSFYGKIEGKNVFYWFQNHKARDRQKLRRKLSKQLQQQQLHYYNHEQLNQQNQLFLGYPDNHDQFHGSSALQQLSHENSVSFLPQGGSRDVGSASTQATQDITWKQVDIPDDQMGEIDNSKMTTYDYDWNKEIMVEMDPIFSPRCPTSLQTLQLFPVTATNLKED
ncbi:hypothetical protein F2P56_011119 [Juglans regia]|uniref:Homeobox domain-containing protein n=2 Tax=Juglans regia TaxID=51240 RepID=A0A834CZD8_JUGRE|nr:WUSCHEL-related homeobox 3-like [Juglans regia]KAF5470615.1 hypothetical protein F2P56_011119 [Juglans regia]